ncbi:bifunctional riboflavin kinase/FAD synthetase [Marinobacterium arenosum]|uniref:bifunctional riboflavin kinase/FAD synthetase n=1 Tax=Marinobacterium arenosum TaxID=2862496 RepID=UPI001C94CA5C|nr:bifunctional riboflavin kinase/FAD synthetase [Marinobacterium arenosum]MBY4678229.1 bifunctional riboflavin kinase/FAD synthetase [Marinobacterium arenosum]
MELIRGLHNLRDKHRGCVATIGNFDGVHLGHRRVLDQVKQKGQELGLPTVAITFEPQPQEFFSGNAAPRRLTRFDEKVRLLTKEGIDRVLCLSFNERLRNMTADQFIERLLLHGLAVKHFVVGDDFRFGCDRSGDYNMLATAGSKHGFTVAHTATFQVDGDRVSSTRIRNLLAASDLAGAAALLGRPYAICGRVVVGQQLGRQLGVPTANVRMHRYPSPLSGVYAVLATLADGRTVQGVANIGMRPTVNGSRPVLEAHLFDLNENLYGSLLKVEFQRLLRHERRFDGLDALKQQIHADIDEARAFFEGRLN